MRRQPPRDAVAARDGGDGGVRRDAAERGAAGGRVAEHAVAARRGAVDAVATDAAPLDPDPECGVMAMDACGGAGARRGAKDAGTAAGGAVDPDAAMLGGA